MTEKKSIILWVLEGEKKALLERKDQQKKTWREYFLTLAGIPHEKILRGKPSHQSRGET